MLPVITAEISKEFLKPVLVAALIAWSCRIGTACTSGYENFAYRVDIQRWVFVVAGMIAVLIALITVSTQAIRAANANPVKKRVEDRMICIRILILRHGPVLGRLQGSFHDCCRALYFVFAGIVWATWYVIFRKRIFYKKIQQRASVNK
jgi:hypothetical protein